MTLQTKLETFSGILAGAVNNLYHYWRPNMKAPYCVWAEDGEGGSFHSGNTKSEQAVAGSLDYYTKTEFDTVVDTIQSLLNSTDAGITISWRLNTVDYEEETNLIHWSWEWVIA